MLNFRAVLSDLPSIIQYVVILGLIFVLLYICLIITRKLGEKYGDKVTFDDPEEYEKGIPDIFASTFLKRKKNAKSGDSSTPENAKEHTESKDDKK